ncbi:hypothetical protein LCGC14_2550170 [marine sediment metagenome]|uniref:Uncharacterized protein n=1 Tax=marine sediment metagenome TaxID=412755 RepID=A0A0F9DG77_9ZZZZ
MARIVERDVALSEMNLRGIIVQTTASRTLEPSDSGIMFVSTYVGNVEYTLPAVADGKGKIFLFIQADDGNLKITSTAANIVVRGQTATTQQTSVAYNSNPEGSACAVMGDGTRYLFLNFTGTEPDTLS